MLFISTKSVYTAVYASSDCYSLYLLELATVVATITNTTVKGANIKVQKLEIPYTEVPSSSSSPCRLRVSGIPSIDLDHLGLLIERATQLECNLDFLLEQKDEDSSLMTFKKHLSEKGI